MTKRFVFSVLLSIFYGCGSNGTNEPQSKPNGDQGAFIRTGEKQLNINILWDLSDRVDNNINPSSPPHYERDIEIMRSLTDIFKKDMQKRGAYKAKSRIRIFFTPPPANDEINTIAKNLSVDLSRFSIEQASKKKEVYDSLTQRVTHNAKKIYDLTIQANKLRQWEGSDIWRFFKNNVKDYCIDKSKDYRNVLVILTDGYIYHKDSKERQGNRSTYILPEMLKPFRNNKDWKKLFTNEGYGLISTRTDLQDLEILVLEITPSKGYKNDEDVLKEYLGKWFLEMGVAKGHYACFNSDLPEYTQKRIEEFLSGGK